MESIDMDEMHEEELELRRSRGDYIPEDEDDDEVEDEEDNEPSEEDEDEDLEDGEDDNEEEEDEEYDDDGEDSSNVKIPKSRLDQVIAQREAERERVKWLEQQLERLLEKETAVEKTSKPPVPEYDFDSKEEDYLNLILEGETEKAVKLRREIDNQKEIQFQARLDMVKEEAIKNIKDSTDHSKEDIKFDALVENYESKYSFLSSASKDYNEEAVDTINMLMAGFIANGNNRVDALKRAVDRVAPMFDSGNKRLGSNRKSSAIKRNVRAAKQQPAKTRTSRKTSYEKDSIDITKLSEREFNKLTPREIAILRGDAV